MDNKINSVERAELIFIIPVNNIINLKSKLENDMFLQKLLDVQDDEFNEELCDSISRDKVFDDEISYKDYILPLKIYVNNYNNYNTSLIYLIVSIYNPVKFNDFTNLIHGKNILHKTYINRHTLFDYLYQGLGYYKESDIFLFQQIAKTSPEFPIHYDEGIRFIEKHKQNIHQLLLRSDSYHNHLRIDNHLSNFDNISNFYGSIDLCSPITLIQFYQFPIKLINENAEEIDMEHRACWWLVITDMIFIQKSVLIDTLNKINQVQSEEKKKTVKATIQIGKVLLNMKKFWYFEDITHEISKTVLLKVKKKIGIVSMLDSVIERVEYLENMVLREINEEQNKHNYYLNIILLIIAMIQILPIIYEMLNSIFIQNSGFSVNQLWLWIQSIAISLTLPFLIVLLRKINERKQTGNMLAIKKSKINKNN